MYLVTQRKPNKRADTVSFFFLRRHLLSRSLIRHSARFDAAAWRSLALSLTWLRS